jgi:hypothetical protein
VLELLAGDRDPLVRAAAMRAHPAVAAALRLAAADGDADVRAYARQAGSVVGVPE